MSIFKKIGKALSKYAAPALGIAGAAFGAPGIFNSNGGLFSAKSGSDMGAPNAGPQPEPVNVTAPAMGFWEKYGSQIGSAAVPIATGALNMYGQSQTNAANAKMAQQQMDFQKDMSNTSYQRGTADMKAAGLNPMLAYSQGGASSPGGASAIMGNEIGQGANSAFEAAQNMASLQNMAATNEYIQSQTENMKANTRSTDVNTANQMHIEPEFKARGSSAFMNPQMKAEELSRIRLGNYLMNNTMESAISSAKSTASYDESRAKGEKYGLSEKEARSDWWKDKGLFAGGYHSLARNEVRENVNSGLKAAKDLSLLGLLH